MLSEKEEQFILSWEAERESLKTFSSKLSRGLPMALMYGLPIVLFIVAVQLFFPKWYTKISNTSSGTFITIIIAVTIFILFFAYFRMHYKWETNEQLYKELKSRQRKLNAGKET